MYWAFSLYTIYVIVGVWVCVCVWVWGGCVGVCGVGVCVGGWVSIYLHAGEVVLSGYEGSEVFER